MSEPVTTEKPIDPAAEIRSWLPAHAHEKPAPGLFDSSGTWTWTTTDGTWVAKYHQPLFFGATLSLIGPGGSWVLVGTVLTALRRLHGVLIALDAIEGGEIEYGVLMDDGSLYGSYGSVGAAREGRARQGALASRPIGSRRVWHDRAVEVPDGA